MVFLCLSCTIACAQEAVPIQSLNGEFIREWLILGPFLLDDKVILVDRWRMGFYLLSRTFNSSAIPGANCFVGHSQG